MTVPFAILLLADVVAIVSTGWGPQAAITTFFLLLSAFATWVLVPHLWVPSDRAIRDERREQIVARQLRRELALGEVREPGSEFEQATVSTWHRRPSSPSRW
jgi:hypothetical protein